MVERTFVRFLVAVALCLALLSLAMVPVPVDDKGNPELPAPALGQTGLYRLEVALLVFYGDLLLVTPAFSGLTRGRLPIEISTRGAKFAEETDQSAKLTRAVIGNLEQTTRRLTQELGKTNAQIERLKEGVTVDD